MVPTQSLPQIQAGVGASADEISWIQTAYLIPEVVMIPLSGFLSRLWGTQRLFLVSCAGFVLMSIATGLSSSIDMMILFRAIQGFVGGAMIPTVFAVAFTASASVAHDIYNSILRNGQATEEEQVRVSRITVVVIGVIAIINQLVK